MLNTLLMHALNNYQLKTSAGRVGRNGEHAHDEVVCHGNQLAQCDPSIKEFVETSGCIWEALFKHFNCDAQPRKPLHCFCSNYAVNCTCDQESCKHLLLQTANISSPPNTELPKTATSNMQCPYWNIFMEFYMIFQLSQN